MIKAAEGCDFIVHTASPFPSSIPKDPMVLVKPAVEGTLAICEAARIHKIKRLVITSSVATLIGNVINREDYDETVWVPE